MKKGCSYGLVAWIVALVLGALLAPLFLHLSDPRAFGQAWAKLAFIFFAIPAFVVGYIKQCRAR